MSLVKDERANSPDLSYIPAAEPIKAEEEKRLPQEYDDDYDYDSDEQHGHLQALVSASTPEILEQGVTVGVQVLNDIKGPLEAALPHQSTQAAHWIKAIQDLEAKAKPSRTIVGVVGNTGAGKSSVISAVLDEERLLPTNCMRACTASPTEISYNYSDDPDKLYRAEVEFIAAEDWRKELQALFVDMLDGNGEVSRDCSNPESEAGIAYAKVKAVYPKLTKEMIALSDPDQLVRHTLVQKVLGTTKTLQATTASSLYSQLQNYVDSKEKNTDKSMEYWPLIKVVRIFTKAAALATGACLVDLPGVQDSNAARAAVAERYMKACTGLWIVAPITRAVDDKTAKTLLGDSFRRQLKYDGTYSAVTFICSKTDDISVTEAAESLGIEDQISESWSRIQDFEDKIDQLIKQIGNLKDERGAYDELLDAADDARDKWEDLAAKLADGETVYAPQDNTGSLKNKRKRSSVPLGSRKNRVSADPDGSDWEGSDASDKENSQAQREENLQPLTEEQIDEKLTSLKAEKKTLRQSKRHVDEKIAAVRAELNSVTTEKAALYSEVKAICIKGRNDYSRHAIKQDFAAGIRELDQEQAAEVDESNFDPDADVRDYDAVAESLPVFCVSSRAFQKLQGRLRKDDFKNDGFQTLEDTEVPQLQAHAQKLTEAGRASSCRRFLNELIQLLNSMMMWATDDGTRLNLADGEKEAETTRLRRDLQKLEKDLENAIEECINNVKEALAHNIYDRFSKSIPTAVENAMPTATGWGAHRSEGGLVWATYKATCRRMGQFTGSSGPRDFNAELFEPISKQLAGGWERAFQRRLPSALDGYSRKSKKLVQDFHKAAITRARTRGAFSRTHMLDQQLQAHLQRIADIPRMLSEITQELQRDASRRFTPIIQDQMAPAYTACTEERGPGSFMRMKQAMSDHVEGNRDVMFQNAFQIVQDDLRQMCRRIEEEMASQVQDLYVKLARDYLSVLVGANGDNIAATPRAERLLRAEMVPLLRDMDRRFAGIVTPKEPVLGDVKGSSSPLSTLSPSKYHDADADFEHNLADVPPSPSALIKAEPAY